MSPHRFPSRHEISSFHPLLSGRQVGETYTWEVVLYCGGRQDSPGRWTSAEIEVVEPPADLAALALADRSRLEQAMAYAAAGFWYDAIALVYDAQTPQAREFRRLLLLDLADLEAQPSGSFISISDQLRDIADRP